MIYVFVVDWMERFLISSHLSQHKINHCQPNRDNLAQLSTRFCTKISKEANKISKYLQILTHVPHEPLVGKICEWRGHCVWFLLELSFGLGNQISLRLLLENEHDSCDNHHFFQLDYWIWHSRSEKIFTCCTKNSDPSFSDFSDRLMFWCACVETFVDKVQIWQECVDIRWVHWSETTTVFIFYIPANWFVFINPL